MKDVLLFLVDCFTKVVLLFSDDMLYEGCLAISVDTLYWGYVPFFSWYTLQRMCCLFILYYKMKRQLAIFVDTLNKWCFHFLVDTHYEECVAVLFHIVNTLLEVKICSSLQFYFLWLKQNRRLCNRRLIGAVRDVIDVDVIGFITGNRVYYLQ